MVMSKILMATPIFRIQLGVCQALCRQSCEVDNIFFHLRMQKLRIKEVKPLASVTEHQCLARKCHCQVSNPRVAPQI